MSKYEQRVDPVIMQGPDRTQYLHNKEAGVAVPLMQTISSAVIVGVAATIFAYLAGSLDPWRWGIGMFAASLMLSWFLAYRHWFSLTNVEKVIGVDLNRDGKVGDKIRPRPVKIDYREINKTGRGSYQSTIIDFPVNIVTEEEFVTLCKGLVRGTPFSEREWAGTDKLLSGPRFRLLQDEMLKRGMIAMKNEKSPQQGYVFTEKGEMIIKEYANAG